MRASIDSGSRAGGSRRCDGAYDSENGTRSSAFTVNSATVCRFSPESGTGVRSTTVSGPAIAFTPASRGSRVTHGTEKP